MQEILNFLCQYLGKNPNFRKIEKERENDLEQLYSENLENILDHNELRQSLKKSYEVK